MSRSNDRPVFSPPELWDGLSEGLTTALTASELSVDQVIDNYLAMLEARKPAETWQKADYHASVLARLVLPQHRYVEALEQALVSRIRERLHATT